MRALGVQLSVARIVGTTNPEKTPTAPKHLAQFVKNARREWLQQLQERYSLFFVFPVFINSKNDMFYSWK